MDNTLNAEAGENASGPNRSGEIFGHPRGLATLFFTEMWERFSYYGMRALLMLYMTAEVAKGGLGLDNKTAAPIYALYASSVYFLPLIGGWLADRYIGARRATLIGGIIIMLGHFTLAFPPLPFFYGGLVLVAIGTGFLKSNISAMVGDLYERNDPRRDAGFSIFYMGINIGAFLAPLIVGSLGEKVNWHYGFAAAGFGMAFGLIQYVLGAKSLKNAGLPPQQKLEKALNDGGITETVENKGNDFSYLMLMLGIVVLASVSIALFNAPLMPTVLIASLIAVLATGAKDGLTGAEWRQLAMIGVLFTASCFFWAGFEQAPTSLNLFARDLTDRSLPVWLNGIVSAPIVQNTFLRYISNIFFSNGELAASAFQAINALFIILLAPVFSWLWIRMGKRQPSDPAKFSAGLIFLGFGFVVAAYAAYLTGAGKVSPYWLILVYLFHTTGELCLSPVGLSSMTKLAPVKMVSLMLGVWFLSISLGNYIAGLIGGEFEPTQDVLVSLFGKVAAIIIAGGVVLAIVTPFVNRLTANTETSQSNSV